MKHASNKKTIQLNEDIFIASQFDRISFKILSQENQEMWSEIYV